MPILDTYHLTFRAGLHIGRHGIGQEEVLAHVPADTLFAALVAVRAQMRSDAGAWAERFRGQPPFRLTSAFPFAGKLRFYPRPVRPPPGTDPKRWGKIQFVSKAVLMHLLVEEVPDSLWPKSLDKEPSEGLTLQGGALWLLRQEADQLPERTWMKVGKNGKPEALPPKAVQRQSVWAERTVPRVTVDRVSNASEIYHTGRTDFAPGCGLWFGVAWHDESQRGDLEMKLDALGDAGLGAERSVGYGAFTWERRGPLALPDAQPNGLVMLLSRYYPHDAEDARSLTREDTAYQLIYLAGRVKTVGQADQRRRGVRLVAEGSLIGDGATGTLANVRPEVGDFPHPVYRYGLALGVGLGGKP